jgi:glyoxylase-like metal-dependent hydrolase (beta-lactamase superfamily II)
MTGPGTNSYLVGKQRIAVVDPGPDDEGHIDRLEKLGGGRIEWIALTHGHLDHAPGAVALAKRTGAQVISMLGPGTFEEEPELSCRSIGDRELVGDDEFALVAVHTPGHSSDHICWYLPSQRLLFTGDHIMGGSTVVIAPLDGDMGQYIRSLRLLLDLDPAVELLAPGHGPVLDQPGGIISGLIDHRMSREQSVEEALQESSPATVDDLVPVVYSAVDPLLFPVARYSLWAHLRNLASRGRATTADPDDIEGKWSAVT